MRGAGCGAGCAGSQIVMMHLNIFHVFGVLLLRSFQKRDHGCNDQKGEDENDFGVHCYFVEFFFSIFFF